MSLARLPGKVAIVTGAGRGLGRAIAMGFAHEGANVVVASRTKNSVDAVVGDIKAMGATAIGIACDVGQRDDVWRVMDTAAQHFGTIDILVNNAQGFGSEKSPRSSPSITPLEDFDEDEWEYTYRTGCMGTLWAMKAAFPHLKKRGGKIINFGAISGQYGRNKNAAYATTKEAIRSLTVSAAREWGPFGINVNIILPMVKSDSMMDFYASRPGRLEADMKDVPLGRFGEPEDVAKVATFLASGESDFLSGMTFLVDGGRFAST